MRTSALLGCLFAVAVLGTARAADAVPPEAAEFFEKKVRPLLAAHCYRCHSAAAPKLKGGLRLDSRAAVLRGGDSGPALTPGHPERSRLIEAVRYENVDLRMPPRGKLPAAAIADLTAWVKMGAPWPHDAAAAAATGPTFDLEARRRGHWAWQPVRPYDPPAVRDTAWPRTGADRFILRKLEDHGLTPAPPADRRTLIRRLSFDLLGLPPSPEEVEAFLHDAAPGAYGRLVDRLLASPHFGERWGRHWLDLVRYAETRGHEFDYEAPNAHQYRDYVIRALNADVPYDRFVTEHIAGDLLSRPRLHPTEGFNESVLGTGFWFLGEALHSPVDTRQDEADRFDNMIDVFGKTFLGLTVACARCHDHKFDAISARDYYALFGVLESSGYRQVRFDSLEHNRQVARELWELRRRSRPLILRALAETLRPAVERAADYLLAAREVLRPLGRGGLLIGSSGPGEDRRLASAARKYRIDAARLGRWVGYLREAGRDPADPLRAWAVAACARDSDNPERLAERLRPWIAAARPGRGAGAAALAGFDIVVDYGKSGPADWMQDGFTFGPGPLRPGDIVFGSDPARPVTRIVNVAAAEKDIFWDGLRVAPGTENDPGVVGSVVRSGRTLRTPTFRVTAGKVCYLVRGSGRAYAAVDQHVLINGPLHGQLVQPLRAGPTFQWVVHDLSAYRGHLAHVEFTAEDGADFAVAMVVQGERVPAVADRPDRGLRRMLDEHAGGAESLATGYQHLLQEALERLAADRMAGSADATEYARLADWLSHRPELFATDDAAPRKRLDEASHAFLEAQARLARAVRRESRLALAMLDGNGLDEHVFIRGSYKNAGPVVPRRFLEALAGSAGLHPARGSGRLELARQLTDPAREPLVARVMVNRVWHHLFGRGIVASTDNFGVLGERPTHPELLDYLADRFVRDGWSLKRLIRTLVLSSTYRMSSHPDPRADALDAQDLLLHRMRLRRLEGEAIRDAMLTVSGRLDARLYGPPVPVYLTEFQDGRGRPPSGPLDGAGRRSVYLAVRRNFLSPFLLAFDTPIPFSTVGRRSVSNVPAQALILMNDPFVHQQAEVWARRVRREAETARGRVELMYREAFGGPPREDEVRGCMEFLKRQARLEGRSADDVAAWTDLAHVLFNMKEFVFLP
jgi:hypothetical protein